VETAQQLGEETLTTLRSSPRRRFITRYLAGDDLVGGRRTEATWWRDDVTSVTESKWACRAGWKRTLVRVSTPPAIVAAGVSAYTDPALWANSAGALTTVLSARGSVAAVRAVRNRRFRRVYVRPLTQVVRRTTPGARVHIDPDFSSLAARLVRPMSPAEKAAREWYGEHLQTYVRWAPDRLMRAYWSAHEATEPFRNRLDWFRNRTETEPVRVEITLPSGFATKEQRDFIRQAVVAKLGVSDLVETWDQVGPTARGMWTVRERPPEKCVLADVSGILDSIPEWEFVVGITTGGRPVIISLDDDAPHIACSAGSGAGKSVLAKAIAVQVLRRTGRVTIFDRKGSHRWARGLAGVTYCTRPEEMQKELIRLSEQADARNERAMHEDEGWDPGQREFVIFEEMNATIPWLRDWWDEIRDKNDPKKCPAVTAFKNIMFMGRSAKTNLFGVAQMLTANTTGGPESRENFGIRALARYTMNNWKMLAPECPMPKRSKTRGRWQFVIAGEATETQVLFLTDAEARALADVPMSPSLQTPATQGKPTGTPYDGDTQPELITLREAIPRFCPGISYDAVKKRRERARRTGGGPKFATVKGRAELYDPDELLRWLTKEELTETENENV
jgi:hypothetical protein